MNNFKLNISKVACVLSYFNSSDLAASLISVARFSNNWDDFFESDYECVGISRDYVNDFARSWCKGEVHTVTLHLGDNVYEFGLDLKSDDVRFCIQKNYNKPFIYKSPIKAIMKWEELTNE